MLVISRKKSERILIGENVWLTVCAIKGNRVQFGIDAPKEVRIVREEVDRKDKREAA